MTRIDDDEYAPIVRLVQLYLFEALQAKTSKMEMWCEKSEVPEDREDPGTWRGKVRYATKDGWIERDGYPSRIHNPMLSRLKILAHLDIALRGAHQEGVIQCVVPGSKDSQVDVRIVILPDGDKDRVEMFFPEIEMYDAHEPDADVLLSEEELGHVDMDDRDGEPPEFG